MENLLLIFRIILVAVFGVAGVAKLFDLSGSKKAIEGFGVPNSLAKPIGVLLPVAEILIALVLIFVQSSWYGAIGATALLTIFIGGMLYQMAKGNAPDCHCFGQVHSEPVSPKSILRNVIFFIPAIGLVVAGSSLQGLDLFTNTNGAESPMQIIIGLVLIGLLVAVVYFLKQISEQQVKIIRRIEILEFTSSDGTKEVERKDLTTPNKGMPIGTLAPDFELPDLNNKPVGLVSLLKPQKPVAFFFVSPTCNPCGALLPEIEQWQVDLKEKLDFVFISSGGAKENAEKLNGKTLKKVLLQKDREIADLYGAKWTPTVVLVNAQGRIASVTSSGDTAIRELFARIKELEGEIQFIADAKESNLGTEIPQFELEDTSGNKISEKDLLGKTTLVTYWSQGCGWCQKMLEDLRNWDKSRSENEPNLLIVSSGELESHKDMGLASSVVLDNEKIISNNLGMSGTPSAVLINDQGQVISDVAVGSSQIWALVGRKPNESN